MVPENTLVIGGNFFGHDSAIFAILPGQKKVFAVQTERLTRYKHDTLAPIPALQRLVSYENIDTHSIKKVVICQMSVHTKTNTQSRYAYEYEAALRRYVGAIYKKDVENARGVYESRPFVQKILGSTLSRDGWKLLYYKLVDKLSTAAKVSGDELIHMHLSRIFPRSEIEIKYYDHEYCHVACASVTAPFNEAIIFSIDGWGEDYFARAFLLKNGKLEQLANSPTNDRKIVVGEGKVVMHSIGGIYEYFTEMLGFTPSSDEGKVEALAAYGKPAEPFLNELLDAVSINKDTGIDLDDDKLKRVLDASHFRKLLETHGKETMSATVQTFLERIMSDYVTRLVQKSGVKNLALAGGVAANVINNLGLLEKVTDSIHITPAMADDGAAQGAAYAYLIEQGYSINSLRAISGEMPYYSTSYSREQVASTLERHQNKITIEDLGAQWPERVGELLANGKIGAIFHGKMEWGPRALGNRSIIADPRRKDFRDKINKEIKRRPLFQPFCPSMLAEEKDRLFEQAYLNKHMTCAFRMRKEFWESLPSAIHIDGTARVQFVEEKDNPYYYRLLKKVKELTEYGVVINTSFNKHGRTIVETPEDAVTDFLDTDMDYLCIEGYLVKRI